MANLTKFTLNKNDRTDKWELKNDETDKVIKSFDTKQEATKGGALENAIGGDGGSVKIKSTDGTIEKERTYPRREDPRRSKG